MTEEPAGGRGAATLSWGLKQSFRAYVEGSGGVIEAGEGAVRAADGAFAFPAAPGEGLTSGADGRPEGVGRFAGAVRCEAHGGMLKVAFADPSVEIGPDGAAVFVADVRDPARRIALAVLDLAKATLGDDGAWVIPAKLARDGWQVLGDHYPQSTPLDPVRLTLAV
jgi:hypothetical protein